MVAGKDTNPLGDEFLHHYWTKGPGLAKWVGSPTPWRTLHSHLVKHMNSAMADRCTSAWFHEVFGYWSGDRKGKNPVGPG